MAATYVKGSSGDTLQWAGNLTVDGTQIFTGGTQYAGDVTLGDAVADTAILKGRLSTSTVAGAALAIDATTYQYAHGAYLRYNVADWADTYTLTDFRALYLRAETNEANATGSLYGAEVYGVANNVGVQHLKGILSYAYIKGTTAKTVATAYGVHAELSWDAGAASTTISTEMAPILAKITGGAANDYTKIHGMIIRSGDMDGSSRTYGNGILIQDDADMSGTITWTTGINITSSCTTGITLATGTFTTGINVGGTLTTGVIIGASTTGLSLNAATTTAISVSGATTTAIATSGTSGSATGRVLKGQMTVNNAAYGDGYGLMESELTLTGTDADHVAAFTSWINMTSGTHGAGGLFIAAQNNGIYEESGATITNANVIYGMRAQCVMTDTDAAGIFPFSLNVLGPTNVTTALFYVNAAASEMGEISNAGSDTSKLVPLYKTSGGTIGYVKIYTTA